MRPTQSGTVAGFVCLILVGGVKAQQPCPCAGAGVYTSGPVSPSGFVSGPIVSPVVVSQPAVAEFVTPVPMLEDSTLGQPVIAGEAIMPATTAYVAPVMSGEVVVPAVTSLPAQGQVLPYSYWVLAPNPARIYVEYGEIDQFPYQGRAYGNPSDRWSWYYMGGGNSRYLAKYYYPILQ